ncbi:MAG: aminoacyl-tRNA hydrolase [Candidatus Dormibacteria bacterium]
MSALVIGLGNHGREYSHTRHNAGWMALDELERRGRFGRERREGPARVREGSVEGYEVITARPHTYMNLSGRAGAHLTDRLGIAPEEVIVVHDEVDLPLGALRLKRGGGSAGHRGVTSLADSWHTRDFIRVRIGVGRPADRDAMVDHVLDTFHSAEREQLGHVISRAADAVLAIIRGGLDAAMTELNRPASAPE